jgi:hypothetical protein
VSENLHPTIKWSAKHPYPLESEVEDIPWQIVNQKENINSNLDQSMFKASNSFIATKGSMSFSYKIIKPTSMKYKADNQDELSVIKRLKTLHISCGDAIKPNNNKFDRPNKKQKLTRFDEDDTSPGIQWDGDNYSCAYYASFTIFFNIWAANPKKKKEKIYSKNPISIFLHCMMVSKNI